MIKTKRFLLFLLYSFIMLSFCQCGSDEELVDLSTSSKSVLVSLSPELFVDNMEEPLTKGEYSSNDLYGINIYYSSDGTNYTKMSSGLFDNTNDMTVSLLTGYTYKFECTLVKDGKNVLGLTSSGKYSYPFYESLNNSFLIDHYLQYISEGYASMSGSSSKVEYPAIERYYGVVSGFVPGENNNVVSILLKRMVFGVRFNVEGLVQDVGSISVTGPGINAVLNSNGTSDEYIRSFNGDLGALYDQGEEDISFTFQYNQLGPSWSGHNSGTKKQVVKIKRNYLTTINITLDFPKGKLLFEMEDVLMDDSFHDLGLSSGSLVDIEIEPTN